MLSRADALCCAAMNRAERIAGFTDAIWEWYAVHKRILPWRDMPIDDADERAYRVLVSEVMLQQTQVSRVQIVFKDFLDRFPRMQDLALASNGDVIRAWRGMGYNSRALRLRDAARFIVTSLQVDNLKVGGSPNVQCATFQPSPSSAFPREMDELLAIPGIGPYTAAAIRNFAFNLPTPCIDTNIRRILHRTFVGPEEADGTWSASDADILEYAEDVLARAVADRVPDHDARNWHAALMDYGSLVQTKNHPTWDRCILTARGLMRTTPDNWTPPQRGAAKERLKREPGRSIAGVYVPNRIVRGKVVEVLRDAVEPLSLEKIGSHVCIDWAPEHRPWLRDIVDKLVRDELLRREPSGYSLA